MTALAPTTTGAFELLPIGLLHESPWNTRKHFDQAKLESLAENIRKQGIITPLVARPADAGGYELAAGHRRFRAAQLAGVTELPVMVREMDDVEFLEVLQIENLQREDIHELEEAAGYAELMKRAEGYTAKTIADKVGRSEKYVWDRLKLLELIPELQEVFLEKKIDAGHAIILARLKPTDQKRAADPRHGGLWEHEDTAQTDLADLVAPVHEVKNFGRVKPRTVRELQGWVTRKVRFDATKVDPVLFPETAAMVPAAIERAEKIVSITRSLFVHPEAKTKDGERTFGPASWKRADGRQKSKECDRSVIGVLVVGEGQGDSFRVCVDKTKCRTHWGSEIKARESRPKTKATPAKSAAPAAPAKSKWEIEREQREAKQADWKKLQPAILKALVDRVKGLPVSTLISVIQGEQRQDKAAEKLIGRGSGAEGFVRLLAFNVLYDAATDNYSGYEYFPKHAKEIGLDLKPILAAAAPKPAPATPTKPVFAKADKKAPAKKGAKKRQPNADFMKPLQVSAQLAAVIGAGPMARVEVTKKLWGYIKKHSLQDAKERRMIVADVALKPVFGGKARVSMFEMTKLVNKHLK